VADEVRSPLASKILVGPADDGVTVGGFSSSGPADDGVTVGGFYVIEALRLKRSNYAFCCH